MNNENELTIDWQDIEGILKDIQVDIELCEPIRPAQVENLSFLVLEQMGLCRLSEETRAMEEERLAKLARKKKSLRQRKKYTRKRGTVHPKTKAMNLKNRRARRWARDPVSCLTNGYGYWTLDRKLWEEHVAPLWKIYNPAELSVKKTAKGTRLEPHTLFNIKIMHRKLGTIFDGSSLELYLLSSRIPESDKL